MLIADVGVVSQVGHMTLNALSSHFLSLNKSKLINTKLRSSVLEYIFGVRKYWLDHFNIIFESGFICTNLNYFGRDSRLKLSH